MKTPAQPTPVAQSTRAAPTPAAESARSTRGERSAREEVLDEWSDAGTLAVLERRVMRPVQAKAAIDTGYGDLLAAGAAPLRSSPAAERIAAEGTSGPATAFPHRTAIESSFGRPLAAVAHVGPGASAASAALGAQAYAFAGHVGFSRPNPSLFVAAHEAAHVMQDAGAVQRHAGDSAGDPYEAHADAVAARVVRRESAADLVGDGAARGVAAVRLLEDGKDTDTQSPDTKQTSARFEGDKELEEIKAGTKTIKKGDTGTDVTKLQQALIDLGYLLPSFGVDGIFGDETKAAVIAFQKKEGVTQSGELDQDTIVKLHALYDTRKPYIDRAKHDTSDPGTRKLSADDKKAAVDAMVPQLGATGAPAVFTETVGGKKYGDKMSARLSAVIASLHKELYADKVALRSDPTANFHDWSVLEGPAAAAKDVVDAVYDTHYGGKLTFGAMTHKGGNFIDQWEDEEARNAALSDSQKKAKATDKVWYLINSNCRTINRAHGAVPSATTEKGILTPIVDSLVDSKTKVQTMLDLDIGWEGAQLEGVVYLQRFKSTNPDTDDAKEENRVQMWDLFQTCIHEYLHTVAHTKYQKWAQDFKAAGDDTRYNTLIEGFCDFFTLNVRSTVTYDATLATKVEGPYANGNAPAPDRSGVYPSHEQAEQVVSIVGVKNAQAAYFQGETKLMGAV